MCLNTGITRRKRKRLVFFDKIKYGFQDVGDTVGLLVKKNRVAEARVNTNHFDCVDLVFFLRAAPGSLRVSVKELDGSALAGVEVRVLDSEDNELFVDYTSESGLVSFKNLPSRTTLSIEVDAGPSHKTVRKEFELESSEEKSLGVEMERALDLEISLPDKPKTISEGCSRKLVFTVTNKKEEAVEVQLVGDGDLEELVSSEPKAVGAGEAIQVDATISLAGGERKGAVKKGSVRIKYSRKGVALDLLVTEAIKISVSPDFLRIRAASGELVKEKICCNQRWKRGNKHFTKRDRGNRRLQEPSWLGFVRRRNRERREKKLGGFQSKFLKALQGR